MTELTILGIVVAAVVGYFVGYHVRAVLLIKGMSDDPEHFIQLLNQVKKINQQHDTELDNLQQGLTGTELAIEKDGNMYYGYTADTKQFIAQGSTLDDLMEQAAQRHPGKEFFGKIVDKDSAKELA